MATFRDLLVAAKSADARMMRLLAAAGADPQLATDDGTNALMLAAGLGKRAALDITYYDWTEEKAVDALAAGLELGLDVDAANAPGETALPADQGRDRAVWNGTAIPRGPFTKTVERLGATILEGHSEEPA